MDFRLFEVGVSSDRVFTGGGCDRPTAMDPFVLHDDRVRGNFCGESLVSRVIATKVICTLFFLVGLLTLRATGRARARCDEACTTRWVISRGHDARIVQRPRGVRRLGTVNEASRHD